MSAGYRFARWLSHIGGRYGAADGAHRCDVEGDEEDDGEGVGPVWVDTFGDDDRRPQSSDKWDRWVRRSEAARFAEENGYEFVADE